MTREWTIRHPGGHVDEQSTATTFGPSTSREFALQRLELANSDCLCVEGEDEVPHTLVFRDVPPPPPWSVHDARQDAAGIHKATPADASAGTTSCLVCKELVRKVPGGQGTTWVHDGTGMVAAVTPDLHPVDHETRGNTNG